MSDNEVKIKISADTSSASRNIKNAADEVKYFGIISENAKNKIDILAHGVQFLSGALAPLIGAFVNFAKNTIGLNSDLENLAGRLQGLIAANSSNITSTGEVVDANKKWVMSGEAAKLQLEKLKQTSQNTAFSVSDLANGFSMFYATAANQGSIAQANEAFNSIAVAAKVAGKNMGDLTPMFDSLATGSVVAGSEMGAFMRIVGLTNEELKKANENGRVFDYINEKLAKFKELNALGSDTYENALSRFKSELSSLQQELGKGVFESFKSELKSVGDFLNKNHDEILKFAGVFVVGAKHIGIFGAALLSTKATLAVFKGASNLAKSAMISLSATFTSTASGAGVLNTALNSLKMAFKTFLPTAIVFGGLEMLISYLGRATSASDTLAASVAKTSAQIKAMSAAQRENELNELSKARNTLLNEQAKFSVKANKGDIFSQTADFWLGGADIRRTANQAKADEYAAQIKQIDEQINRIKSINALTFKDEQKSELMGISAPTKAIEKDNKELEKQLKERNRYLLEFHEQRRESEKAWAIKEDELRTNLKGVGFNEAQINEMVATNKATYMKRFEEKIKTSKVKGPKISANKDASKEYETALNRAIAYYEAINDKENKRLKERELKSIKLRELGLSEAQISANLAREDTKIQIEEDIKKLASKERYYELLGEKAKAASIRNQIRAKELEEQGASKKEIAGSIYGKERMEDNYANLSSALGYDTGEMGKYQNQINAIDEFHRAELERIRDHYKLLGDEHMQGQAAQDEIFRAHMQMRVSQMGVGFDAMAGLAKMFYDASGGQNKTALRAYQAMMIGKAIVNTYTAASNAYASAANPYLGAAMAAVAIAQGMAQVAQIKAQKFHTGGFIGDKPLARDEVPAILQTGEFVLSRKQVSQMKDTNLEAKSITNEVNYENSAPIIVNTISPDMFEQWASSYDGRRVIKNVINGG